MRSHLLVMWHDLRSAITDDEHVFILCCSRSYRSIEHETIRASYCVNDFFVKFDWVN